MAIVENNVKTPVIESNDVVVVDDHKSDSSVPNNTRSNDNDKQIVISSNGYNGLVNGNGVEKRVDEEEEEEGFKNEMRDLEEMLSKLNPMAEEFVPLASNGGYGRGVGTGGIGMGMGMRMVPLQPLPAGFAGQFGYAAVHDFLRQANNVAFANVNGVNNGRKKGNFGNGKQRMNSRSKAQREDVIKRTVHVSDIDQQVTEEQLAALFINCGLVVNCRICGDPNSVLRFAFIEFTDEEGANNALTLAGTMLGYYPVRVLPSKTAIAPVNPTFLPRSEDEREMCARTIYCTNIDKKVTQADVKLFFETLCGEVYRLRLLGDYHHSSRIAFVEFLMGPHRGSKKVENWKHSYEFLHLTMAESAITALNCSGAVLGSLPVRVSPSKTPIRSRTTRPTMH